MADSARNSITRRIVEAKNVRKTQNRVDGPWECRVCGAEMAAVACGAGSYRVSPHFRAIKGHASYCDAEGKEKLTTSRHTRITAETRSTVREGPVEFRLSQVRRQRGRAGQPLDTEDDESTYVRRRTGEAAEGTHGRTVTTIRPVAEYYCDYPKRRDDSLKIPGCRRKSYRSLFWKLKGSVGYRRWPPKILFAPIRFRGARTINDTFLVYLNRPIVLSRKGAEEQRRSKYYRISLQLNATEWSERTRNLCREEWTAAVQQQDKNYREDPSNSVYAFFLGEQDPDDLSIFMLRDHRSVCFLNLGEHVVEGLEEG